MFDDKQTDQTGDVSGAPHVGLGVNPSLGGQQQQPQVVLPGNDGQVQSAADEAENGESGPMTHGTVIAPLSEQPQVLPVVTTAPVSVASNDLEEIKRGALEQLSPLVSKLDQTPEDKYKTLMMMIQASDNQDLIGEAYQNAQQIVDEKVRAEALLSIVTEINYFSQKTQ